MRAFAGFCSSDKFCVQARSVLTGLVIIARVELHTPADGHFRETCVHLELRDTRIITSVSQPCDDQLTRSDSSHKSAQLSVTFDADELAKVQQAITCHLHSAALSRSVTCVNTRSRHSHHTRLP